MKPLADVAKKIAYLCLIACIISIGSLPILFIFGNDLKIILFLFHILISIIIFYILESKDINIVIYINDFTLRLLIIVFSITVFFIFYTNIENDVLLLKIPLVIIFLTIIPGYSLLYIIGIKNDSATLTILQSFVIGYFISSVLMILLRLTCDATDIIKVVYLIIFLILVVLSSAKYIFIHNFHFRSYNKFILSLKDLFGFLIIFALFCYGYSIVTPYGTYIINTDFSRHYMYNLIFIRSPRLFYTYPYFLFDIFTSLLLLFLCFSPHALYLSMTFLNFMNNISYYILLKIYTKNKYKNLPILALIIWSLFSSFAWINFTINKLTYPFTDQIHIYWSIWNSTYMSFLFTPGLWFFEYGPQYVSNLFMFVYLSSRIFSSPLKIIKQKLRYLVILSIILAASTLTHILPPFVFIATLCISYLFHHNVSREELMLISCSIFISLFILIVSSLIFAFNLNLMYIFAIFLLALFPFVILILEHYFNWLIQALIYFVKRSLNKIFIIISTIIIFSFIYYAVKIRDFRLSDVYDIVGEVPWYFYPYMLGISSVMALLGIYYYYHLTNDFGKNDLTYFMVGICFCVIAGRLVTLFNKYLFHTYIWEYRIFRFIPIFIAPFSAIMLQKIYNYLRKRISFFIFIKGYRSLILHFSLPSRFFPIIILSLLTMTGTITSFLTIEYQNLVAKNDYIKLSSSEFEAINWLKEYLNKYPNTFLIILTTDRLYHVVAFAGPPYRILVSWRNGKMLFWEELSAMVPNISKLQNILLISYKNNDEIEELKKFILKDIFRNEQIEIYEVLDGKNLIDFIYKYGKREILRF